MNNFRVNPKDSFGIIRPERGKMNNNEFFRYIIFALKLFLGKFNLYREEYNL